MFGRIKRREDPPQARVVVWGCEPHITRLIQVNLERQGHAVTVCDDEETALNHLEKERANMLVVDPERVRVDVQDLERRIQANPATADVRVWPLETDAMVRPVDPPNQPGPPASATAPATIAELLHWKR